MNTHTWMRSGLATLTLAGLTLTARTMMPGSAAMTILAAVDPVREPPVDATPDPDSIARSTARRDPFRLSRTAASVPYRPESATAPPPPEPDAPARPALALAGVVTGDDPAALVDGIPGTQSTIVLRLGERHGEFLLRSLTADQAVIATADTVWTLHMRARR